MFPHTPTAPCINGITADRTSSNPLGRFRHLQNLAIAMHAMTMATACGTIMPCGEMLARGNDGGGGSGGSGGGGGDLLQFADIREDCATPRSQQERQKSRNAPRFERQSDWLVPRKPSVVTSSSIPSCTCRTDIARCCEYQACTIAVCLLSASALTLTCVRGHRAGAWPAPTQQPVACARCSDASCAVMFFLSKMMTFFECSHSHATPAFDTCSGNTLMPQTHGALAYRWKCSSKPRRSTCSALWPSCCNWSTAAVLLLP